VIRNVAVHIANEQPLLADLFDLPASTDAGLLCTNLRSMDGKRPVFIDTIESTFFFPYHVIRFLEVPTGALERHAAEGGRSLPTAAPPKADRNGGDATTTLPAVIEADAGESADPDDEADEEIDEDFLRRIRDI
jgi:hypothetical protein